MMKKLGYGVPLLGLCLLCSGGVWAKPETLSQQLAQMDQAASQALDSFVYTIGELDATAWMDGVPVIIKVPILNEKQEWQGDTRYYFKQGKLFAVKMPYGSYQFDEKGNLILWLDEEGKSAELPGSAAWGPRQNWLKKRATQLANAFAPSAYARELQKPNTEVHVKGEDKVAYLCMGQLYALTGAEKIIGSAGALKVHGNQQSGAVQLRVGDKWLPITFSCQLDGADRVSHLTYRFTLPAPASK